MATNDATTAQAAVDVLDLSGIPYALLHGESDLAAGLVSSDIDIVVGTATRRAARILASGLHDLGLMLCLVWWYDIGCLTQIYVNSCGTASVQLDFSYSPRGRNRLGLRTDRALMTRVRGERWWRIDERSTVEYLISKRAAKGDVAAVERLLRDAGSGDPSAEPDSVIAPWRRVVLGRAMAQPGAHRMGYSRRVYDLLRYGVRCCVGSGVWVDFAGPRAEETADLCVRRMGSLIPNVVRAPAGNPRVEFVDGLLRRTRPGLVVGVARSGALMPVRPHRIEVWASEPEVAIETFILRLDRYLQRRLARFGV